MLVATGLAKSYGGVHALRDGRIELATGEIHALVGENGAGKSTMVKILSGVVRPDAGRIEIDGELADYATPRGAAAHGIAIVSQELSLFPDLSVGENLFASDLPRRRGLLDRAAMSERAAPVLELLGLDVATSVRLGDLSLADQQLVEIARALLAGPSVLILDEPTSALPAPAARRLEEVLHSLAERGIAILYISHYLEEVRRIADRVSVLRDGEVALEGARSEDVTLPRLVAAMLGDRAGLAEAAGPRAVRELGQGPALVLAGVGIPGVLQDVDLEARPGEIVGVAGLEGAGHLAVLELVCGLARPARGTVTLPDGSRPHSMRRAIRDGVAFVPGDRKRLGLMLDEAVWQNATSVRWLAQERDSRWLRRDALVSRASNALEQMNFRGRVDAEAGDLSGGNQQKVVFAKWMDADPTVVVLDDPTRGVDIGARAEMHDLVRAIADGGRVVLLSSTDLGELAGLCDRVVVFQRGKVVATLTGTELTEGALAVAMNAGFVAARES